MSNRTPPRPEVDDQALDQAKVTPDDLAKSRGLLTPGQADRFITFLTNAQIEAEARLNECLTLQRRSARYSEIAQTLCEMGELDTACVIQSHVQAAAQAAREAYLDIVGRVVPMKAPDKPWPGVFGALNERVTEDLHAQELADMETK